MNIWLLALACVCFAIVVIALLISASKANHAFGRCPNCGGVIIQVHLIDDDRDDLVICDKCESVFVMDDDGLTDVFGIPPTTEGGNHEQRRTDRLRIKSR